MKKLLIVCEERLRHYGDFLAQLLSLNDDKEDNIVGTKDGAVVAQVWNEKEYIANAAQISSEQYILFIGNSLSIKEKRIHMMKKFDKFGMQYGWLGKQAMLFVEKVVDMNKYDDFINFAKSNQTDIEKVMEIKKIPEEKKSEVKVEGTNAFDKMFASFSSFSSAIANASIYSMNLFNAITNTKKIEEQEYSCLILEFYLNGLNEFLGLNESPKTNEGMLNE